MQNTSCVSVIVPVYNAEQTISRCIESIVTQTLRDIEIIVVDDGTPDDSIKIVEDYASRDHRIRILHQDNAGLGAARNAGTQEAKGELLAFVDSDDFIEPDMLETMVDAMQYTGADVANCETFIDVFSEDGSLAKSSTLSLPINGTASTGFDAFEVFSALVPPVLNSVCFKMVRRSLVNENGIRFPENYRFAEDMPVTARLFLASPTVAFVHKPLYHYVRSNSVLTSSFSLKKAQDLIEDMQEICAAAIEAGYPGNLNTFKLEMLFSVIRQITWSGNAHTVEGKALLEEALALRPQNNAEARNVKMPLMQAVKVNSVASGTAPLLCRIAYLLRWVPAVKHLM